MNDFDIKSTVQKLKNYKTKIRDTDRKVRLYLSDRRRYAHPLHEDVIKEIRDYERIVHRIPNNEVQLWLDNVMYSLMVHERLWKRLFEKGGRLNEAAPSIPEPEKAFNLNRSAEEKTDSVPQPAAAQKINVNNPLVEKVFKASLRKWSSLGIPEPESKKQLAKRILPTYQKVSENLKDGQKIKFVYNTQTQRIDIKVKEEERA